MLLAPGAQARLGEPGAELSASRELPGHANILLVILVILVCNNSNNSNNSLFINENNSNNSPNHKAGSCTCAMIGVPWCLRRLYFLSGTTRALGICGQHGFCQSGFRSPETQDVSVGASRAPRRAFRPDQKGSAV